MISKGAKLAVLVSLVCAARSFCQESSSSPAKYSQWTGVISLGFAPTFFNAKYADGDCWVSGFAFSCDYRALYKPNGLCFAAKMLIGGVGSDTDLPSGYNTEDLTLDTGELNGWDCWTSLTVGKQFEYNVFTFTPMLGLGASYFSLEGEGQASLPSYTYYLDCDVSGYQVAVCADFTFGIMFTDYVGISASLLLSCSLFGSVSQTLDIQGAGSVTKDYSLDFASFSFIPSFYLTARL